MAFKALVLTVALFAASSNCGYNFPRSYFSYSTGLGAAAPAAPATIHLGRATALPALAYNGYKAPAPAPAPYAAPAPAPAPYAAPAYAAAPAPAVAPAAYAEPAAYAAPAPAPAPVPHVTSSQFHAQDEYGRVSYGYANPNSAKKESRDEHGNVIGTYTYQDASGYPKTVSYVADAYGFRLTGADNLPLPVAETPAVASARAAHYDALNAARLLH